MGAARSTNRKDQQCRQGFGAEPEGKRPRGRPEHRWENNITRDL